MKNGTRELSILLILYFAALGLRVARLFDLDIWFDEAVFLFRIEGSLVDIWNACKVDNFPPLFPWLLNLWHSIFPGENAARLFSALVGSLTPPAAYILGKEVLDRRLGWLLGIACCISVPLIYCSQMIRMYPLFPFCACLSIIGFLRGIKNNHWKDWILVSMANLLGYYTFSFMLFLVVVEFLILLWTFRLRIKDLVRPLVAHLPALILMLFWILPLLHRFEQLQQSFWVPPLSENTIGELWLFLGTGSDFHNRYLIASVVNLPFLLGFLIGFKDWWKNDALKVIVLIFLGSIALVFLLSFLGQSIFFKRYFLYLVPVYLSLVLVGWLQRRSSLLRRLGMSLTFLSFLITLCYYYIGYYEFHAVYVFPVPHPTGGKSGGHVLSEAANFLRDRIAPDEVIIHYSNPVQRSFSFFPMVYYHDRTLPEYIYSSKPIPQHYGQQYLKPGEWIKTLNDINPLPQGIWMVSFDPVERLFNVSTLGGEIIGWRWVSDEDLPEEIRKAGFSLLEAIHFGRIVMLHFRREVESVAYLPADSLNSAPVDSNGSNSW